MAARKEAAPIEHAKLRNRDLHGNVPEVSPVALLLIDVINAMDFRDGDELAKRAEPAAKRIAALKKRARAAGIPAVYANDNFGRWTSDFRQVVDHCLGGTNGAAITRLLAPEKDDYFVLKPKHSAFYATTLDTLLVYLGAKILILTGFAGDNCVMFTAHDAYMRDYTLVVPADCTASTTVEANDQALAQLARVTKADTTVSDELDLDTLLANAGGEG
jgi:nicotinamidase-related amidase